MLCCPVSSGLYVYNGGSYSFLTPDGQMLEVRYTAGKNGFVILNPEEVFPQQVL